MENALEEMRARRTAIDAVVAIRVDLHVKGLAHLHERFRHLRAVAVVHVVVGRAVNEQEVAVELVGTRDGIHQLIVGILLWRAHVALGVDGVVEFPVGRRRHRHASAEEGRALRHGHQRVEAAEAPTPNRDARSIDIGKPTQIGRRRHLVLRLEVAETEVGAFFEIRTACARTAAVHDDTDVAILCEEGFPHTAAVESRAPSVFHFLTTGAAVLVHHDGIFALGIKIAGLHHPAIQLRAVGQCEGEEFLFHAHVLHLLAQLRIVDERFLRASRTVAQGRHRRYAEL